MRNLVPFFEKLVIHPIFHVIHQKNDIEDILYVVFIQIMMKGKDMLGEFEFKVNGNKRAVEDFENIEKTIKDYEARVRNIYDNIALAGEGTHDVKVRIKEISEDMKVTAQNVYELKEVLEQIIRMYSITEGKLSGDVGTLKIFGECVEDFFLDMFKKLEQLKNDWVERIKENNSNVVNRIKDENTRNGFSEEYQAILQRIYDDVPEEYKDAKELYDKYSREVVVADFYSDSSYHSKGELHLSMEQDINNERGNGTTYYHEYGHFIVYKENWIDGDKTVGVLKEFEDSLRKEISQYYQSYEEQYRKEGMEKGYSDSQLEKYIEKQTEKAIQQDIVGKSNEYYHINNGISDIIDGVSNGKYQPSYGHKDGYWEKNSSRLANEAFAQFFSAQMTGDTQEVEKMKELMPETYEIYCKMIQEAAHE